MCKSYFPSPLLCLEKLCIYEMILDVLHGKLDMTPLQRLVSEGLSASLSIAEPLFPSHIQIPSLKLSKSRFTVHYASRILFMWRCTVSYVGLITV